MTKLGKDFWKSLGAIEDTQPGRVLVPIVEKMVELLNEADGVIYDGLSGPRGWRHRLGLEE